MESLPERPARTDFLPPPSILVSTAHDSTAHDRPTLRFPAVPPPVTPVQGAVPTPVIDLNEPTLQEQAVQLDDEDDDRATAGRDRNGTTIGLAPGPAPRPPASIEPLRPRKKGTPPPHRGMPAIDPAAWLADEAHARSSDRRDSADGVDPSDTIVPVPKPLHPTV